MLTVDVRFVAGELTPGLSSGSYDIESGTTIRELISICESKCGSAVPEHHYKLMYPLFNGKPVPLDGILTNSGTLHLCRVVSGG